MLNEYFAIICLDMRECATKWLDMRRLSAGLWLYNVVGGCRHTIRVIVNSKCDAVPYSFLCVVVIIVKAKSKRQAVIRESRAQKNAENTVRYVLSFKTVSTWLHMVTANTYCSAIPGMLASLVYKEI